MIKERKKQVKSIKKITSIKEIPKSVKIIEKSKDKEKKLNKEGLEEEIEETQEEIKSKQFNNFLRPSSRSVNPDLGKVETFVSGRGLDLEGEIPKQPGEPDKETRKIEYQKTYMPSEYLPKEQRERERSRDLVVDRAAPIDLNELRPTLRRKVETNIQINPELRRMQTENIDMGGERDYLVRASKIEKDERLPFEKRKYKSNIQ